MAKAKSNQSSVVTQGVQASPYNGLPTAFINVIGDQWVVPSTWISEYTAFCIPSWYAGVKFLSSTLASFDRSVFQNDDRLKSHPINVLLGRSVNQYTIPFSFFQSMWVSYFGWGNAYVWIKKDVMGRPMALYNLNPELVAPYFYGGDKYLWMRNEKQEIIFGPTDFVHLINLPLDNLRGVSPVQLLRQMLMVDRYAENHAVNYWRKGSFVKGYISSPFPLEGKQMDSIKESMKSFKGVDAEKAMEYAILPFGLKMENLTQPNETGQLIETRYLIMDQIASVLGLPPHIVGDLRHGKYNTISQLGDELVRLHLMPHILKFQQAFGAALFSDQEQQLGYRIHCHTESMMRGDLQQNSDRVLKLVNGGLMLPNEGRAELGLPKYPGGDEMRIPISGNGVTVPGQTPATDIEGPTVKEPDISPDDGDNPDDGGNPTGAPADPDVNVDAIQQGIPGAVIGGSLVPIPNYQKVMEPLLKSACERIEQKTTKAFDRKKNKTESDWLPQFAIEQETTTDEVFAPLKDVAVTFGHTIDTKAIAKQYRNNLLNGRKELLLDIAKQVIYEQSN